MGIDQLGQLDLPYFVQSITFDEAAILIQYADPDDLRSHRVQRFQIVQAPRSEMDGEVAARVAELQHDLCALIDALGNNAPDRIPASG